jgi:hypothetical protein
MPPTGFSLLTHCLIVAIGLLKRLAQFIAKKIGLEVFFFKLNLYVKLKISEPLTSQTGDARWRRLLSYGIILFVFVSVSGVLIISVGSRLRANSNIHFISELLKERPVLADTLSNAILLKESKISAIEEAKYISTLDTDRKICDIVSLTPFRTVQ